MSCPICNHRESGEDLDIQRDHTCSKCGSDLEIFDHIEKAHKVDTFQKKSMLVLTAMLGIVMVSWGSVSLLSEKDPGVNAEIVLADTTSVVVPVEDPLNLADASKPVEEFVKENEVVKAEPTPIAAETEVVSEPAAIAKAPAVKEKVKSVGPTFEEDGYVFHKVRKGDSFWKISKRYFGNGNHAKQIAKDNNLNPKKNIPLGTKLKINK